MTKREVLELFKELLGNAVLASYPPDDMSGIHGRYYVDHEVLMYNIETAIANEPNSSHPEGACDRRICPKCGEG